MLLGDYLNACSYFNDRILHSGPSTQCDISDAAFMYSIIAYFSGNVVVTPHSLSNFEFVLHFMLVFVCVHCCQDSDHMVR